MWEIDLPMSVRLAAAMYIDFIQHDVVTRLWKKTQAFSIEQYFMHDNAPFHNENLWAMPDVAFTNLDTTFRRKIISW